MSCPTCGHTMHRLGCQLTECLGSYWCPRCGTINTEGHVSMPALVERCRKLEDAAGDVLGSLRHRLGIREAIALPEDRPA